MENFLEVFKIISAMIALSAFGRLTFFVIRSTMNHSPIQFRWVDTVFMALMFLAAISAEITWITH